VLGHEPARFGFTRDRAAEETTAALLRRLGHPRSGRGASWAGSRPPGSRW
jgi:hypothetical protein